MNNLYLSPFIIYLSLVSNPLHSEPFCFVKDSGELKCIDVSNPILGGAGGGGCGGSSQCGNNNMGTDWIEKYAKKHPEISVKNNQFEKVLKKYGEKTIRLKLSPEATTVGVNILFA